MAMATCSLHWALAKEPLVRWLRPMNSTPSTLMDAFDLVCNSRGYGWDWSHGLHVPRETRPTDRTGFVSHVARSAVVRTIIYNALCLSLRWFSPGLGAILGMSIFDETLPFYVRYLRSSVISIICCTASYTFLHIGYDLYTLIGVLLLGQDPAQWPPGFDAPWRATSLAEFWGRRWHQWYRQFFLIQGGYPLSFVFGRVGMIIGTFLSSALYHHVVLCCLGNEGEFWKMVAGFGMMSLGVLAERSFKQLTGRKVCGSAGWVWTMAWLVLWGNLIIDGFVRSGVYRNSIWPHSW